MSELTTNSLLALTGIDLGLVSNQNSLSSQIKNQDVKQDLTSQMEKIPHKKSIDDWSNILVDIGKNRTKKGYQEIFDHFGPKIKSYGMMLKSQHTSPQMAEELVQDVMLKVWLKAHCFNPEKASASTWIFTIARNCRTDFIRKANRTNVQLTADDLWPMAEEEEPYTSLHQRRIEKDVHEAMSQLPVEQADVLKHIYIEGKSHSEVAASTGLPLGTVKSRVRLAVSKLRTLL